ncbi:MAG: cytochrome c oxidase assembly protein [Candidatus Competibacteraceae bacterium]
MTTSTTSQANRRTLRRLLLIAVPMFGFGFAVAPLYSVICNLTGLNGKPSNKAVPLAEVRGEADKARTITVEFVANVNDSAPWEFAPKVVKMEVHPGEFYRTSFIAENLTGAPLVGQAVPSVTPGPAAPHFQKIECFCFSRQAFKPHESKDMPVVFRLDPSTPADISTVTLSYTFFKVEDKGS